MENPRFKFRVWDIRNGEYFKDPNPTPPLNSDGTLGFTYDKANFQKYYIVEQCTELSDKNGNLIYEGDVVDYFGEPATIVWDCCGFKIKTNDGICHEFYRNGIEIINNVHKTGIEIIGNIHEQAEQKGE